MTISRKRGKKPYCLATGICVACLFVTLAESSFIGEGLKNARTIAKPTYKPTPSFLKPSSISTIPPLQRIPKKWGMSSTDETAESIPSSILGEEDATIEDRENNDVHEDDETELSKDSLKDTLEKQRQQEQQQEQQRQQQIIDFLVNKLDLKIANLENEYEQRRNEKLLKSYLKILSENHMEEGCCFSNDEVVTTMLDQLEECFSYLEKRFNFSRSKDKKELGKLVKRFPSLLVRTTHSQQTMESTLDWLQEVFDLNPSQLKKLVQRQPSVLSMDIADDLEPKSQWIQSRLFGMKVTTTKHHGVSKLVRRFPAILTLSVEDQLELKLQWLQTRLQLNDKQLCKLIQRRPAICGYSIQDNLEPKLDWLQMKLALDDASLSKLVQRKPEVFGYSIDTNLRPKLDWLEAKFQMKEEHPDDEGEIDNDETSYSPSLCKFVKRLPAVFGYSIEKKLEPTCQWLEMRMELNDRGLQRFILRFPSVLGNNVEENLEPTLSFYESCLGRDIALLLVSKNPTMLSASLQTRLMPRLEQLQKLGMTVDAETMRRMAVDTIERWEASLL